jgi:hypothetical protein
MYPWLAMTWNAMLMGMEAQRVIGLRLYKVAQGGAAAEAEMTRMMTEKATALVEAATTLATGGAPDRVLRRYRSHVRANHRRLTRKS